MVRLLTLMVLLIVKPDKAKLRVLVVSLAGNSVELEYHRSKKYSFGSLFLDLFARFCISRFRVSILAVVVNKKEL